MQNSLQQPRVNPLLNLMRQPKLLIKLPSQGKYWPKGSLISAPNGEFPVYSMTAKDELMLKNPSALASGQAVVNVVQSCVPNITDAWQIPNIDMDAILIGIRIATYGSIMKTPVSVSGVTNTFDIDLNDLLTQINNTVSWEERIELKNGLVMYVQPLAYKAVVKTATETIETQKIFNLVNDQSIDEEKKVEMFKSSFGKLTDVTLSVVADSVYQIDTAEGSVTEPEYIKEFMEQCDTEIFNAVKDRLDELVDLNTIKTVRVAATPEMIELGAEAHIDAPVVFDPKTFFL
jgi:putative lipoic acid-binding regulatory protein